jgi:hypothetical protein
VLLEGQCVGATLVNDKCLIVDCGCWELCQFQQECTACSAAAVLLQYQGNQQAAYAFVMQLARWHCWMQNLLGTAVKTSPVTWSRHIPITCSTGGCPAIIAELYDHSPSRNAGWTCSLLFCEASGMCHALLNDVLPLTHHFFAISTAFCLSRILLWWVMITHKLRATQTAVLLTTVWWFLSCHPAVACVLWL